MGADTRSGSSSLSGMRYATFRRRFPCRSRSQPNRLNTDLGGMTHPVGLISGNNREPSMVLRHERQSVRRCEIAVTL